MGARSIALLCSLILIQIAGLLPARAQGRALVVTPVGPPIMRFDPARDACDGHDVPDIPLRAFRDAEGVINTFGLHFENRRMRGASLEMLKVDCPIVFRGSGAGDPAAYDDRSWIAATWTSDGRTVHALAHHEFQAQAHQGRCAFAEYIKCWWNSVLALRSDDGGARFRKVARPVVAASPEPSEIGQGRHRGFFNPSNIVSLNGAHYALIATTGWTGQSSGVCLFRTTNIADPSAWRAFDGSGFAARFPDPYAMHNRVHGKARQSFCQPVGPFPAPVGSISRQRGSGLHVAVFQAAAGTPDRQGGRYPLSGFYTATSRNLLTWSAPVLLMETRTLYDDPCGAGVLRSYPALLDPGAETRNFEDIGTEALLFYSEMRIDGCTHTSDRKLVSQRVRVVLR